MSQPTQRYKRTLKGSIGSGMQSLMGSERRFYILEHKVSSKYHKAGENQQIIVDQIEIGRDSTCQVRFDESFATVSRKHAAIVRDGDNWRLVQLSQTNSTFLNGQRVQKEWYLQNGDEIQLSVNGPKMGFITLAGKKGTVGSLGLTRRLTLFRQQALRPYKYAIATLSLILILAVGGLTAWNLSMRQDLIKQNDQLSAQIIATKNNKAKADSLTNELAKNNRELATYKEELTKNKKQLSAVRAQANRAIGMTLKKSVNPGDTGNGDIDACFKNVYYLRTQVFLEGEPIAGWIGTGFMLNNGYLVTAQHCVIGWSEVDLAKDKEGNIVIKPDGENTIINGLCNTEDLKVVMECTSTSDNFTIEYSTKNIPFKRGNPKELYKGSFTFGERMTLVVRYLSFANNDWAYYNTGRSGGLDYDSGISRNLPAQTHLHILGFPVGHGAENKNNISPIYSQAVVGQSGLDTNGMILTSNLNTDGGDSGGPVMILKENKYYVVGIHVGRYGGRDDTKGRVVPISNVLR